MPAAPRAPIEGLDSNTLRLLRELLDLSERAGPALARTAGLSHSELSAMQHLMGAPLGPAELGRRLGVTSAASSGIVDRLEARGHLQRVPHPGDGRRTQLLVTDEGRAEVWGHLRPMFAALVELDRGLSPDEREIVDRFLTGAQAAIRRVL